MTTPASWVGWFKQRGGFWVKLSEADSYDLALALLLQRTTGSGDLLVLPAGRHPDRPRHRPAARPRS